MKLSFSTLGCPEWDVSTVISRAVEYGFQGIEFRGIRDQLDVTRLPEFTTRSSETSRRLKNAGLSVACFSSSVFVSHADNIAEDQELEEIKRYAELADRFQAPFIRVFGGKIGQRSWDQAILQAAERISGMIELIGDFNVRLVIETHDDWMDCRHLSRLMQAVDSPQVGILWDVNHPFMFIKEDPVATWREVGEWILHTHWKDSIVNPAAEHGFDPCLMGEGVVPHSQIYQLLKDGAYSSYLSLEWEKRWHPEIPGPEIAFPQYVDYMRQLMKK